MRAGLSSKDGHIRIDIGVCTYRRPELEKTLHSLAMLDVPANVDLRIIVADNDSAPSAAATVDGLRVSLPYEIAYVHCPSSNISIARNACLENARGDFLAFIDDDETASPGWIENLLRTAQATTADAVLGPVKATYRPDAPRWMKRGDFHSTFPVWVAGEIITGYTCNVLLRLDTPSLAGRRFNLALGRSGGEDTEFFTHMHKVGGKIAYAAGAWVEEPVPPGRAAFSWLAKRKFRFGQTHGRLIGNQATAMRKAKQLGLAMAKSGFCALVALLFLFSPVRRNRYALRACLHIGVVVGLLGVREIEQYGAVEVRSS
ncbi:glycosyltransferase [Rhizobium favelukesii]|uniref:Glycosyl transferase n=1 Tax=Rhizobium favelukesii TaxID=348824 RepID=W6S0E8_9HYPH|nr:glycosyltransferase family 2 protein [Rhizobium favelukesii]MCS0463365.1 glycosyltransferase [Rhizobium favelukesii]CDM59941.1 putative glycosyl transferase [Rhizobium favelukesii]